MQDIERIQTDADVKPKAMRMIMKKGICRDFTIY